MDYSNSQLHINGYIECGLCETTAKELECLEIQLKTCDTYECVNCEKESKKISDIRRHMTENENGNTFGLGKICHLNIKRSLQMKKREIVWLVRFGTLPFFSWDIFFLVNI